MKAKRKKVTVGFKDQVAIDAFIERDSLTGLSNRNELHSNLISERKPDFVGQSSEKSETEVLVKGAMCLIAVRGLYGRGIVAWDLSNRLNAENALTLLKQAIGQDSKPEIIDSDQEVQIDCVLWKE